ncbi:MAG: winged helix-turn-helix domain-containing protein [Pseudomonadota bacterium]
MIQQLIRIGNATFYPGAHEIHRDERVFALEPKDLHVLAKLLEAAPDVVPNDTIMRSVWQGAVVSDNSLHQSIRRLRQAFGDDARRPVYIQNVPKVGYRLVAAIEMLGDNESTGIGDLGVVAVLPFKEYSLGEEPSYVVDGLFYELQTALAQRHFELISTDVVLEVRRRNLSERELHLSFGVDCVLDGVVAVRNGVMRVTAALSHVQSGRQLWSGSYDATLGNLLETQQKLAGRICQDLITRPVHTRVKSLASSLKKSLRPCTTLRGARPSSAIQNRLTYDIGVQVLR